MWGSSLEARKLKKLVELPLHGAWDWVRERLMKGKVSSGAGIYWPVIPKWGDRQVCLITWLGHYAHADTKNKNMKTTLQHIRTSLLSIAPVVVMSCTAIFLVSCSNKNLSRGQAAELISRSLKLPEVKTVELRKSFVKKFWSDPSSMPAVFAGNANEYSEAKTKLDELEAKGLISVGETKEHRNGGGNFLYATVKLTDAGRKYLVKETDFAYQVKTGEIVFGEVTGVQIHEQFKVAEADYTLKWANMTPFGSSVSTQPINRKASFGLFDDGWRIQR